MNKKKSCAQRYLLVDGIRGLAVVNMVVFHFLYDVFIVYGKNPGWYGLPYIHIWQQAICRTFIFVSGFVWQISQENETVCGKNKFLPGGNFRRGIFFNICGFIISLITKIFLPAETVWFGILNFMGCAVLFMTPLHKPMRRCPPVKGMIAGLILFAVFKNVQMGYLGIGEKAWLTLPQWLYRIKILTPFGFPFPGFVSSDYFPMFPWLFLFWAGYFFYGIFEKKDLWKRAARRGVPVLSAIGQKSIWIYLLHQPVCMMVCVILFD